jgi:hypothetical protein
MKSKKVDLPSIYEEKQFQRAGWEYKNIYLFILLFFLLFAFRFLNLGLWWTVNRLELTHNSLSQDVNYTFLNLSNHNAAQVHLRSKAQDKTKAEKKLVVAYFNFLHPMILLVHNPHKPLYSVDLGRVISPVGQGSHLFTLSLTDVIRKTDSLKSRSQYFGSSLLGKMFMSTPEQVTTSKTSTQELSYTLKSLEKTTYLKIPYLIYFFIPLIIIIVLASFYSRAILTAYFYFPLLFLLFDFKVLFFRVPFSWFLKDRPDSFFMSLETGIALGIVLIFTALGFTGLLGWKQRRDKFKETLFVLFFLFLPLILRF